MVGLKRIGAIYDDLNHYKDKRGCDAMTDSRIPRFQILVFRS